MNDMQQKIPCAITQGKHLFGSSSTLFFSGFSSSTVFTICDTSDCSHVTLQALHPVESSLGQRGSGVLRAALRDISWPLILIAS